jgi:hypothetical protein
MKFKCSKCNFIWEISYKEFYEIQTLPSFSGLIPCPSCSSNIDLLSNVLKSENNYEIKLDINKIRRRCRDALNKTTDEQIIFKIAEVLKIKTD